MPLGESRCDVVKSKVEARRKPEEDQLDKERTPEFDDLGTMLVE